MQVSSRMAGGAGGILLGASVRGQQVKGWAEHRPGASDLYDGGAFPWGWKAVSGQGAVCWSGWAVLEVERDVAPQGPDHEASLEGPGWGAIWWIEWARPAWEAVFWTAGEVPEALGAGSGQRVVWWVEGVIPGWEAVLGIGETHPGQGSLPATPAASRSGFCGCDTEPGASDKNPRKQGEGGIPQGTAERGPGEKQGNMGEAGGREFAEEKTERW
ncbi:hypothetical protein FKM82_023476 [Ascaphus truei]